MTLRDLNAKQIVELQKTCELDLASRRLHSTTEVDSLLYKLAWSDCLKTLLKRLDYLPDLPDAKTSV